MAEVVLEKVSRVYPGGTLAVNRVDLEVHDKEFLVLVGPSGCGKTTTLRLIAGLEEVTEGTIRIGGRVVNDVAPRDRDIAMVFQNYALYPHMTVRGNMAFGLRLRYGGGLVARAVRRVFRPGKAAELGVKRRAIAGQVQAAARTLGIEHLLDRLPRQLSGGERQRVALGRAIVRQPAAFLFDEPLSNLDARLRVDMRKELKQLHQRLAATTIYVTHDQVEALTLGDRVVVMDRGSIQQVGSAMDVYQKPSNRFVAGFIGTPAMNLIEGELTTNDGHWRLQAPGVSLELPTGATLDGAAAGRRVVLGIRAEDVRVGRGSQPARVTLVEPLGDALLVYMELDDGEAAATAPGIQRVEMVSKAAPRCGVRSGERVVVELDGERIHLFDPDSGARLT